VVANEKKWPSWLAGLDIPDKDEGSSGFGFGNNSAEKGSYLKSFVSFTRSTIDTIKNFGIFNNFNNNNTMFQPPIGGGRYGKIHLV